MSKRVTAIANKNFYISVIKEKLNDFITIATFYPIIKLCEHLEKSKNNKSKNISK
jgi:hypothetical protein